LQFLGRCQNLNTGQADGGFFFTPRVDDPLNKAGILRTSSTQPAARSYGTATADGLIALAACGLNSKDPRVEAAMSWLERNKSLDEVPGIAAKEQPKSSSHHGLKFYYFCSLSRGTRLFPDGAFSKQRQEMANLLIDLQQSDGAWINDSNAMREDDPLIATPFAITALSLFLRKH